MEGAAAAVFAVTFLLLAVPVVGRRKVPRGAVALSGGVFTAVLLRISPRVIDVDILLLLGGLMVLAGLAEAVGVLAGLRRRLLHAAPGVALWLSLGVCVVVSALLLNDAAVLILVPFLLPAFRRLGLPLLPSVVLLAVAANVGSLLTPFGNPQNVVLADAAALDVLSFLRVQGPIVLFGLVTLAIPCWLLGRRAAPGSDAPVPHAVPRSRALLLVAVIAFVTAAVAGPRLPWSLGVSAAAAAVLAYAGLRPRLGRDADRAVAHGLDWNVLALFVGLYFLTGGLHAWFPAEWVPTPYLDRAERAGPGIALLSNVIGNVPATLVLLRLDPAWTVLHAEFLVTVTTLGGSLLLTGSAASLIAAEQARKSGVEIRFFPFLVWAAWALPSLVVGAWLTW